MPGDRHDVAGPNVGDTAPNFDDASAGLVTDRERSGLRRAAPNDLLVDVASRGGDRPNDGVNRVDDDRRLAFAPLKNVGLNKGQRLDRSLIGKAVH